MDYDFPDGSKLLSQHRHIPNCWNHIAEYADGARGAASVISKRKGTIQQYDAQQPQWEAKEQGNSYQIEHDRLFAAIRQDRPFNEAARGAESTMTAILGRMAAYSGQKLTWEQAINSDKQLITEAESWQDTAPVQPQPDGGYEIPVPGMTQVL